MTAKRTRGPLMTKHRQQMAQSGRMFVGEKLAVNAAPQQRYAKQLGALVAQMTAQTRRDTERLFRSPEGREFFATDASLGSQARILMNKLTDKFVALFARKAKGLADSMVRDMNRAATSSTHASLAKLSGGMSLKTSIVTADMKDTAKAIIAENVGLIKSIPQHYLQQVQGSVMRSIAGGNGLADLVPALERYEGITQRRAHNIALDQTRKTYNAIARDKMQALGVSQYRWLHSGGSNEPREDHIAMSGNIYSFDDPPVIDQRTGERGIPGQAPNCRCTMQPVFQFPTE